VDEPVKLARLKNDGKLSPHLPEGTPYGLVGTSSFYKRESYPEGAVLKGSVTATYAGKNSGGYRGLDPFNTSENGASLNWVNQGADAGRYTNDDVHAVRNCRQYGLGVALISGGVHFTEICTYTNR